MSTIFLEKDSDTIYEELEEDNNREEFETEYREDRMDQMISKYGYWGGTMIQQIQELIARDHQEDLKQFAEYLGVDYEDYLEFLHPDVDFDDYSR